MSLQRFTLNDLNKPIFQQLYMKQNSSCHMRTMTIFAEKTTQNKLEKAGKTSQQARKQKMVELLSTTNFRKQLMHTRKMSGVQSQYRSQ